MNSKSAYLLIFFSFVLLAPKSLAGNACDEGLNEREQVSAMTGIIDTRQDMISFREALKRAQELGIKWFRIRLPWNNIQPRPPRLGSDGKPMESENGMDLNWQKLQERVDLAASMGFKLHGNIQGTPAWAQCKKWDRSTDPEKDMKCTKYDEKWELCRWSDPKDGTCKRKMKRHGGPTRAAASPDYFNFYTEQLSKAFQGKICSYDLWNEPNLADFWASKSAGAYKRKVAYPGYEGVKRGSGAACTGEGKAIDCTSGTGALVVGPSVFTHGDKDGKASDVLPYMPRGNRSSDIFSLHIYGNIDHQKRTLEEMNRICEKNAKCRENGFWVTEQGFSANDDPNGKLQIEMFNRCKALKHCKKIFAFIIAEKPSASEDHSYDNYGFLDNDGTIKKRFCGMQEYLRGQHFGTCAVCMPQPNFQACAKAELAKERAAGTPVATEARSVPAGSHVAESGSIAPLLNMKPESST